MHLLVIHYHWRPGGVRQVVESTVTSLAADSRVNLSHVYLASGKSPPAAWARHIEAGCRPGVLVDWIIDPWMAYASEWPSHTIDESALAGRLERWLRIMPEPRAVLVENPAVGRHPVLGRAVAAACAATATRLLCRHHDFFVDGRWAHWPLMQRAGIDSVEAALSAAIPQGSSIEHLAVAARDAEWLGRRWPTHWCPNETVAPAAPSHEEMEQARLWMAEELGTLAPVWLCPTRVLRRKNLLEAALWARWHDPDAVVATTGGASSPNEAHYASVVATALMPGRQPVRAGMVAEAEAAGRRFPRVAALMAASTRVVVSSLFEGFGLPVAEAAGLGVPVTARTHACPDHWECDRGERMSVQLYDEIWVPWDMAGGAVERARQQAAWEQWQVMVPGESAGFSTHPCHWDATDRVPFSRLTLAGQWSVWKACQDTSALSALQAADLRPVAAAAASFPGRRPSVRLGSVLASAPPSPPSTAGGAEIDPARWLADRLAWANHYPLLWPNGDHLP